MHNAAMDRTKEMNSVGIVRKYELILFSSLTLLSNTLLTSKMFKANSDFFKYMYNIVSGTSGIMTCGSLASIDTLETLYVPLLV